MKAEGAATRSVVMNLARRFQRRDWIIAWSLVANATQKTSWFFPGLEKAGLNSY